MIGTVAASHISNIAQKLLHAIGELSYASGMVSKPVAVLTQKLEMVSRQPPYNNWCYALFGSNGDSNLFVSTNQDTFNRLYLRKSKMNIATIILDQETSYLERLVSWQQFDQ